MAFVSYNPKLKELAKKLRKQGVLSEVLLWKELKQKKLGFAFHRQKSINEFIVDFYAPELQLIIEIDGDSHSFLAEKDWRRQKNLEALGFSFLRFLDLDVKRNLEGVVTQIKNWIRQHADEHTPSADASTPL